MTTVAHSWRSGDRSAAHRDSYTVKTRGRAKAWAALGRHMTAIAPISFTAPGPGAWELDTVHFQRPMSMLAHESLRGGFARGFAESCARYGMLLSHLQPELVHGFIYMKAVPFGAPPDAKGPPPKIIFQLLTRLVPKMRRRIALSHQAFERKQWRADLKWWDDDIKPKAIAKHKKLQAIDPKALDDEALLAHLRTTVDHCTAMIYQHHQFTATCSAVVGDMLAHVQGWTGKPAGEILQSLRGSSPISNGAAADELVTLIAALRNDEDARTALASQKPAGQILTELQARAGDVGPAMHAYLEVVSHRCLGYDPATKTAGELPEMLVSSIRAALVGSNKGRDDVQERVAKLRASVPEPHRARFDEVLEEARSVNRLRDERGHYSDGWASGLARRAALEVGRRLVEKKKLTEAEHAVDATADELGALLRGGASPTIEEIAKRTEWRTTKSVSDAEIPRALGYPASGPPPVEWLPEKGRRAQRAISAFLGAMFVEPESQTDSATVKGLPVSPGIYEGTARLVDHESDFGRVQQGDVLVTRSTSPYFNVVLPLLGAIVTDRGGQLSHAAIVSREYGIPGVVGTKDATKLIKDGARVRVNGDTGSVEVLG